ncbi:hypothetical protein IE53DRAFT_366043 [Violaceomyces palustris]|uniref:Uncharacterized protein n=1 Tax=Violaceomyces palustris TaxID=1673888 RepID=A0ACD0P6W9_9BASI|nr:hypothetical protein IE53DRAFT_366043 [Violaceomyces palustris]
MMRVKNLINSLLLHFFSNPLHLFVRVLSASLVDLRPPEIQNLLEEGTKGFQDLHHRNLFNHRAYEILNSYVEKLFGSGRSDSEVEMRLASIVDSDALIKFHESGKEAWVRDFLRSGDGKRLIGGGGGGDGGGLGGKRSEEEIMTDRIKLEYDYYPEAFTYLAEKLITSSRKGMMEGEELERRLQALKHSHQIHLDRFRGATREVKREREAMESGFRKQSKGRWWWKWGQVGGKGAGSLVAVVKGLSSEGTSTTGTVGERLKEYFRARRDGLKYAWKLRRLERMIVKEGGGDVRSDVRGIRGKEEEIEETTPELIEFYKLVGGEGRRPA